MDIGYFLKLMTEKNASDMFLTTGAPVYIKIEGKLYPLGNTGLPAGMVKKIAYSLMDEGQVPQFERDLELNMALALQDAGRFRINVFKQRGEVGMVIRAIRSVIPSIEELNLPQVLAQRPPFPTAGLAVRMMGPATLEKLTMLREADAIFVEEIQKAGLDKRIRQYFAVLTGSATRGAGGEMGCTVALRAMNGLNAFRLPYDLLERVVERVTSEVDGINRVVYDVTSKPPGTIEWE